MCSVLLTINCVKFRVKFPKWGLDPGTVLKILSICPLVRRFSTCRARDPQTATDHCRRAKHLEQLASCHTRSVTVQSRFQETAKDSPVWITIAALVRLNWRVRNVVTYLLRSL